MAESWHGAIGGYTNHRCRCVDCRAANAAHQRRYRRRLFQVPSGRLRHGSNNSYTNYGCRCDNCRDAHAAYNAAWYRRTHPTARAGWKWTL